MCYFLVGKKRWKNIHEKKIPFYFTMDVHLFYLPYLLILSCFPLFLFRLRFIHVFFFFLFFSFVPWKHVSRQVFTHEIPFVFGMIPVNRIVENIRALTGMWQQHFYWCSVAWRFFFHFSVCFASFLAANGNITLHCCYDSKFVQDLSINTQYWLFGLSHTKWLISEYSERKKAFVKYRK